MSIVVMRELSEEEKRLYLAEREEMRLHDEANAIEGSREEGIAEERKNTLATLKKMGLSDEQIKLFIKMKEKL